MTRYGDLHGEVAEKTEVREAEKTKVREEALNELISRVVSRTYLRENQSRVESSPSATPGLSRERLSHDKEPVSEISVIGKQIKTAMSTTEESRSTSDRFPARGRNRHHQPYQRFLDVRDGRPRKSPTGEEKVAGRGTKVRFAQWFPSVIIPYARRASGPVAIIRDNCPSHISISACLTHKIKFV